MRLTSSAFADGATIPKRYTADGDDVSPPLTWTEPPAGTSSFALLCEDPDAPNGTFVHWVVWDIPADRRELREAANGSLREGENSFGGKGYGGPSPPRGKPHRYVFRLLALDNRPALGEGASALELARALEGHILGDAALIGMYGR